MSPAIKWWAASVFLMATILGCQQGGPSYERAQHFFYKGDFQKTIELCDAIIRDSLNKPEVHETQILKGRCFLELGHLEQKSGSPEAVPKLKRAVQEFTKAIELNDSFDARHFRALAHEMLGNKKEFFEDLRIAVELDPSHRYAYNIEPDVSLPELSDADSIDSEEVRSPQSNRHSTPSLHRVDEDLTENVADKSNHADLSTSEPSARIASTPAGPVDQTNLSDPKRLAHTRPLAESMGTALDATSLRSGSLATKLQTPERHSGTAPARRTQASETESADNDEPANLGDAPNASSPTEASEERPLSSPRPYVPVSPVAPWQTSSELGTVAVAPQVPSTGIMGPTPNYQPAFPNVPSTGYVPDAPTTHVTNPPAGSGTATTGIPRLVPPGLELPTFSTPTLGVTSGIGYTGALPFEQRRRLGLPAEPITAPYAFPPNAVDPYANFPAYAKPIVPSGAAQAVKLVMPPKPTSHSVRAPAPPKARPSVLKK